MIPGRTFAPVRGPAFVLTGPDGQVVAEGEFVARPGRPTPALVVTVAEGYYAAPPSPPAREQDPPGRGWAIDNRKEAAGRRVIARRRE